MNLFGKKAQAPQKQANIYTESLFGYADRTVMHSPDDLNSLKSLYKDNAIVYALVDWKASRMSELDFELYKVIDKSSAKEYRKWNGRYTDGYELKQLKKLKALAYEEIELDDISINDLKYGKIKQILKQPNPLHTMAKFIYHYSASRDVSGFQAIWANKLEQGLSAGLIQELYPLPSHLTEIRSGGALQPIESYRVLLNNWSKEYKAEDVLLLSNHSFDYTLNGSQLYGTSKVRAALQEIDTYKYAKERELYSYQTGDAQTVMFPKDMETSSVMNDDDNKTIVQEWIDKVRKMLKQKDRSNISVSPYGLDAIKIGTALKDTNTTESKDSAISAICGVWHINPIILGHNSTNTDGKIKEVTKMALRDTVFPEAKDLLQGMNDFWMSTYKERGENLELGIDFDCYEEFNQDIAMQSKALKDMDFLSDNEKREWVDYDNLEDDRGAIPQKYWDIQLDPMDLNYEDNNDTTE